MQNFRYLLLPFSWVYGLAVRMRNDFYRRGWFKSRSAALPTLIVGNINIGGTGKSPHTRWLAEQLYDLHPAILSRGYGRQSRGFRWVNHYRASTEVEAEVPQPKLHGDEPVMYAQTLPTNDIAVCEDRIEGVRRIAEESTSTCVILDDALQHRRLKGDVELALLRYDRLPHNDHYLPAGSLRDHRSRLREVDAVLITHCGDQEASEILSNTEPSLPLKSTPVFISRTRYSALKQVNGLESAAPKRAIVVTAIAQTDALMNYLNEKVEVVKHFKYRDHHTFQEREMAEWREAAVSLNADSIITTEKDFVRLQLAENSLPIFVQPIEIAVDNGAELIQLIRERLEQQLTRVV